MLVIKVGGSLFDLPNLAGRLRAFLHRRGDPDWLLVPGGGPTADAVRLLDRWQAPGEDEAHWLALRACALNAHFLRILIPEAALVTRPDRHTGPGVLDPFAFLHADQGNPDCLPHRWEVTSDSVAARAAQVAAGPPPSRPIHLVLLKSVTLPARTSWRQAAADGIIDSHLPAVLSASDLPAEVINFRAAEH